MPDEIREQRPSAAEVKFLLTPEVGEAVREWARTRLAPDPYGSGEGGDRYCTTSLYCETAAQDVFHRRRSYGRSKYRVRRYATADMVFLERKLRTKDILSKRRSLVPIDDLTQLETAPEHWPHGWHGAWFGHRVIARRLAPVCQVAYDRIARLAPTRYGIARLTLDANVRAWPTGRFEFQNSEPQPVLRNRIILEIKFRVEMPAVFKALVEEFRLSPDSVSKYRLSMLACGLAEARSRDEVGTCPAS
jgi:hypothetical protein